MSSMNRARLLPTSFVAVLLCLNQTLFAQYARLATLVDQEPLRASLAGIDPNWTFLLDDGQRQRVVERDQIVSWGSWLEPIGTSQIILRGGSILAVNVLSLDERHASIESDRLGQMKLPLRHVRAIIFSPPARRLDRDLLLTELRDVDSQESTVFLRNGDRLSAEFSAVAVSDSKSEDENFEESFLFEVGGRTMQIARSRIVAIAMDRVRLNEDPTLVRVGLDDGSLLVVKQVLQQSDQLVCVLPGDLRLAIWPDDPQRLFAPITYLRMPNPRVVYLSDLNPIGYRHFPFLQETWTYHSDKNVLGGLLRTGGTLFEKGIGMHSASRLAYQIDAGYSRFDAELAIDEQAGVEGSVRFQVALDDGTGTWKLAYTSDVIRGRQTPRRCSIDVTGASRLALLVSFAEQGDVRDHANWLSARLVK